MSEFIGDDIKAVFFDHDDTLVDTIGTKWDQHKHVARTFYDKELTDDELELHWGKPLKELACLLYGTEDTEQAMAHILNTHEAFPKDLFAETVPMLRRVKAAQKIVGIITATSRFSFEHDIELHEVPRELIDYTQTADDTENHKPDPRVFEPAILWLAERDIRPDEVLYIGDGLHDMKAALGAGFSFLGVETGLVTADQFKVNGAKSVPTVGSI